MKKVVKIASIAVLTLTLVLNIIANVFNVDINAYALSNPDDDKRYWVYVAVPNTDGTGGTHTEKECGTLCGNECSIK